METISLFDVEEFEEKKEEKKGNNLIFYDDLIVNNFLLKEGDYLEYYFGIERELIKGKIKMLGIQYRKSQIEHHLIMIEFEDKSYCSYGCKEEHIEIIKHKIN